ncbi:MAG: hypothetical protein PVG79_17225, partial [Gemmatimonadales bacterium]
MNRKPLRTLLLVALLPLGAACASGGGGGASPAGEADEVFFTVENRINPRVEITVRLLTPTGGRVLLGSVRPAGTTTLRYRGTIDRSNYQLEGQTPSGDAFTSQPMTILPGARVVWALPANGITIHAPEGGGGG